MEGYGVEDREEGCCGAETGSLGKGIGGRLLVFSGERGEVGAEVGCVGAEGQFECAGGGEQAESWKRVREGV